MKFFKQMHNNIDSLLSDLEDIMADTKSILKIKETHNYDEPEL